MPSELIQSIITAEEIARELKRVPPAKKPRTHVIDWKDFRVEGNYLFLDEIGEGIIQEFVIISPNSNFSVLVQVDGVATYNGDFSKFQDISMHIESIIAVQRSNKYILQVNDVNFNDNIKILISVSDVTRLERLHCKYTMKET